MSRHVLRPVNPAHSVTVGWDRPLRTFFAQVIDETADEDSDGWTVLWIGCTYEEVPRPELAVKAVEGYAMISPELVQELRDEWADCVRRHR